MAASFVAGATALELVLWPWVQPSLSPLFTAAVLFTAVYAGLRPALFATVLSAVASAFFFLPPSRSLNIGPDDALRLLLFTVIAVVVSSVAAARRRAELRAEQANLARDRLFAVVSHELRTPISPVMAVADLIEADAALPESVREDARVIRRNIGVQLRLIDDLLDFNRIEHGKLALQLVPLDVHAVVCDSIRMCEPDASSKGIRLVTNLYPGRPIVKGDAARLCQVFVNLIRNAVKFTPTGGLVSVHSIEVKEDRVRVEVTDTGIGIAADLLPSIFNPFEQGSATTTRRYGGLGLGLAIVKGVVEEHGGRVVAVSDGVGRGATFAVDLPCVELSHAPSPDHPPMNGARCATQR